MNSGLIIYTFNDFIEDSIKMKSDTGHILPTFLLVKFGSILIPPITFPLGLPEPAFYDFLAEVGKLVAIKDPDSLFYCNEKCVSLGQTQIYLTRYTPYGTKKIQLFAATEEDVKQWVYKELDCPKVVYPLYSPVFPEWRFDNKSVSLVKYKKDPP